MKRIFVVNNKSNPIAVAHIQHGKQNYMEVGNERIEVDVPIEDRDSAWGYITEKLFPQGKCQDEMLQFDYNDGIIVVCKPTKENTFIQVLKANQVVLSGGVPVPFTNIEKLYKWVTNIVMQCALKKSNCNISVI